MPECPFYTYRCYLSYDVYVFDSFGIGSFSQRVAGRRAVDSTCTLTQCRETARQICKSSSCKTKTKEPYVRYAPLATENSL